MDMNSAVMDSLYFLKNTYICTGKNAKSREGSLSSSLGSSTLVLGDLASLSLHVCKAGHYSPLYRAAGKREPSNRGEFPAPGRCSLN